MEYERNTHEKKQGWYLEGQGQIVARKYEYKYFVDGDWASDRSCSELVSNPFGTTNCVISVH